MLQSFKEKLSLLSKNPKDPFHLHIRKRIGKKATRILEERLKGFILLMPSLVQRIHVHWSHPASSSRTKVLGGFLLVYLYQPKDFLPEDQNGLFGYLDDAYLVTLVYELLIAEIYQHSTLEKRDHDYLKRISGAKRFVKAVIPQEAKKIEEMTEKAVQYGEFHAFAEALSAA